MPKTDRTEEKIRIERDEFGRVVSVDGPNDNSFLNDVKYEGNTTHITNVTVNYSSDQFSLCGEENMLERHPHLQSCYRKAVAANQKAHLRRDVGCCCMEVVTNLKINQKTGDISWTDEDGDKTTLKVKDFKEYMAK